jgi:hypothetical protein
MIITLGADDQLDARVEHETNSMTDRMHGSEATGGRRMMM